MYLYMAYIKIIKEVYILCNTSLLVYFLAVKIWIHLPSVY